MIEDDSSSDYDTSDTDTSDSGDGTEDDTEFDYPTEEETFPSDYADTVTIPAQTFIQITTGSDFDANKGAVGK